MASNYAGFLGFLAFVVATVHGWLHGHSAGGVLVAAMASMAALATIGGIAGRIAERLVDQEVRWRLSQENAAKENNGNAT